MFSVYAELLLLHKKDERLANLLSSASYRVRRMDDPVLEMPQQQWTELFRPEIIMVLQELKTEQTIEALDELIQLTPPGLFEMMRIKGLGGKKLAVLWHTAGIDTIEQLLQAAKRGELKKIRGFGAKTEKNVIANIENYFGHKDRFHFGFVAHTADSLVKGLQKLLKTEWISLCGEIRRQYLTVAAIEILAADVAGKMNLPLLRKYLVIESTDKQQTRAHTLDEIPVIIYHVTKANFYYELFYKTGNEAHVNTVSKKIKKKEAWPSEEAIYKEACLPYIVPEMREDVAEWTFKHSINDLITDEHIKGVVHNHTTWSDGVDSLAEFAAACKKKKYEYVVISDHSKNAHYAGGLKEEKLFRQIEEIDKLNKKLTPFKIFKSIECDILVSGELDYTPEVLGHLDMVIVSVHQLLKMDEEKATSRLLKAIENPYTTILGHMTGRQLLIRPGYPVNFKKIIDACAANNVVIEINANPYRLDMDWSHLPYSLERGVMISINPDAHSIGEIDNIHWGVSAARKGGLTREMTWNAMGVKGVEQWLAKKNSRTKTTEVRKLAV
jgi:DNA polymerase (family 10)